MEAGPWIHGACDLEVAGSQCLGAAAPIVWRLRLPLFGGCGSNCLGAAAPIVWRVRLQLFGGCDFEVAPSNIIRYAAPHSV